MTTTIQNSIESEYSFRSESVNDSAAQISPDQTSSSTSSELSEPARINVSEILLSPSLSDDELRLSTSAHMTHTKQLYYGHEGTEERFVREQENIRRRLSRMKGHCTELSASRRWAMLLAAHKAFLQTYVDLFLIYNHPAAPFELDSLPEEYKPTNLWEDAMRRFLELLQHWLPESQEYMLEFIYLAYQTLTLLLETILKFESTWMKCLRDIARYGCVAAAKTDRMNCERWEKIAGRWDTKLKRQD